MMWSPADDALLAGYANGDPDASVAFVRRHQRRVFGLALSIVSDGALAEGVAQEAFTRAWRHASTYDTRRGSVPAWLLTITRNLAIDAIRLRRGPPDPPGGLAGVGPETPGPRCTPGGRGRGHSRRRSPAGGAGPPARGPAKSPGPGRALWSDRQRGQR